MVKLAILFWFYKKEDICINRLKLLRKYNPDLEIYGLYGGPQNKATKFESKLSKYLDDFYVSPYRDPDWKWINGDLMILKWYEERGKNLNWESIVVVQWDMLVFESLKETFKGIKRDQIFLSGLKQLDKKTELCWTWTSPKKKFRKNFLNYLKYVRKNYDFKEKPIICLFILQVFPKKFFDKYLEVGNKKVGMLEYKIPIYAKIFGIDFYKKDFGVHWGGNIKEDPLNALVKEIDLKIIQKNLKDRKGWRIFHPYFKKVRSKGFEPS